MRTLITGITGFVGGHLTEHLLALGDDVAGLSASGDWPEGLGHLAEIPLVRFDLVRGSAVELASILDRQGTEVVYHLAAQANPSASLNDPKGTWALNLGGALTLLEAIRAAGGVRQGPSVVLVGSGVCYGNPSPSDLPVTERCPPRPNNPYAASKAAADLLGIQHHLSHGTRAVMARPFNHAGPRQDDRYALSSFARQVAEVERGIRNRIEVGNLEVVRDYTDVRDIARAYRLLATDGRPGEIYNVGTGRDVSLSRMLETLRRLARVPVEVVVDPDRVRPVDQPRLLADASKLRRDTGWSPSYSTDQTLADMLDDWRRRLGSAT